MDVKKQSKHLKFIFPELFEKSGMDRYQFAEKAGMDYTTVSDLVNGNYKRIGIVTLEKICRVLNVDVGDLFIWE